MMESLIGPAGIVVGIIITYLTFVRGRDKELREDASEAAEVKSKLNYIGSGISDIKDVVNHNEGKLDELTIQVARVEESAASAHQRIDNLYKDKRDEGNRR